MSGLRKDDPVYYKQQLTKLIRQAKECGLEVFIENGHVSFKYVIKKETDTTPEFYEQASVNIDNV